MGDVRATDYFKDMEGSRLVGYEKGEGRRCVAGLHHLWVVSLFLPYCPNYKNRSRVGRGSIQKILPFPLFLIPNGTRGVKKFRTEVSRVVHPEAALETPHNLHVLLGEVELVN